MISYLQGTISELSPTQIILDVAGVGYQINISLNTYSAIEGRTGTIKLLTHLQIKEDSHTLFGFATEEEKILFVHLISVNGVGAGIARIILSSMVPADVRKAIIHEQEAAFGKVKGVGPKTAKRIIIDLKDKLIKTTEGDTTDALSTPISSLRDEATFALISLGFNKNQIEKAMNQIARNGDDLSLEEWIKAGLKLLSA